jgi:hypothetical protein
MPELTQLQKLENRIPYGELGLDDTEEYYGVLKQLLEDSKNIALSNLYPFMDWSEKELPIKFNNWQLRACVEIYNFLGKEGIKSYSENGLSISRLTDGLSKDLLEEIIPNVGYITPKITEV